MSAAVRLSLAPQGIPLRNYSRLISIYEAPHPSPSFCMLVMEEMKASVTGLLHHLPITLCPCKFEARSCPAG